MQRTAVIASVVTSLLPAFILASPDSLPPQADIAVVWAPVNTEVFARSPSASTDSARTSVNDTLSANSTNTSASTLLIPAAAANHIISIPQSGTNRTSTSNSNLVSTPSTVLNHPLATIDGGNLTQSLNNTTSFSHPFFHSTHPSLLNDTISITIDGSSTPPTKALFTNTTAAVLKPRLLVPRQPAVFSWKCPPGRPLCLLTAHRTTAASTSTNTSTAFSTRTKSRTAAAIAISGLSASVDQKFF